MSKRKKLQNKEKKYFHILILKSVIDIKYGIRGVLKYKKLEITILVVFIGI